jgi:2-methylisocitrate lyase-like PEP mutase family enzyme
MLSITMPNQQEKAVTFRALHERSKPFVIPNPWDAGSAKLLASLGFEALATSSGAAAGTLGRRDGQITIDEAIAHIRAIVEATDLPVSADLERGFGDAPEDVAGAVILAAEAGLVGCSIEDATGNPHQPLFDRSQAVDRIAAAVEAAQSLAFPFTLTARCENFIRGNPDLADTIARLQAFDEAGADVLFAPAMPTLDAVREVCKSVSKPVNFMVAIRGKSFSVAELAAAGVKRISLASSLYRAAMSGLLNAAHEVKEAGTFSYLDATMTTPELNALLLSPDAAAGKPAQ